MTERTERTNAARSALATMRAHPIITGTMLGCALIGAIAGFVFLPEEWLILRRIAAGAFAGTGIGLTLTATKMIG